jgi:hypothetical protein
MAIELATAYVSLTASAKGIGKSIAADLGDELTAPLKKAGDDAGKAAGEDAGKSFGSSLSSGLKLGAAGIAAGGALVAGLLAKGFADALDIESANAKLTAQLGLTAQQSEAYGKAAGELYASNYGSSLGEVNEALRQVTTNIGEGIGNGEDALKEVTADALNLAAVFDQDLARTTAAVGQLLKTGLADNAENAFDILTKGFQNGSNKADDLLDTFVEYSTQFRELGLDGETALGLISQGLQGGARDADIVADSLKEFAIRAQDGSELTKQGFDAVGLSAAEMSAAIAGGGPGAAFALQATLDGLRGIEDPAMRAQAAVALFGTQSEDLQDALFALDPSSAAAGLGEVAGAAERVDEAFGDTTAARIESFKRKALQGLATFAGDVLIPAFDKASKFIQDIWPEIQEKAGQAFQALGAAWETYGRPALAALQVIIADVVERFRTEWPQIKAIVTETLTTVGAVISGFVGLVTTIWNQFGTQILDFMKATWEQMKGVIGGALDVIQGIIKTVTALIHGDWAGVWEGIKQIVTGAWDAIVAIVTGGIGRMKAVLSALLEILSSIFSAAWEKAKELTSQAADAIVEFVRSIPGRIRALAGDVLSAGLSIGKSIIDGIARGISNAGEIASDIGSAVARAAKGAVNAVIRQINGALEFTIPGPGPLPDIHVNPPDIPQLHTGGVVGGRAGQDVLRILQAGEVVLNAKQQRALGSMLAGTAAAPAAVVVNIEGNVLGTDEALGKVLQRALYATGRAGNRTLSPR